MLQENMKYGLSDWNLIITAGSLYDDDSSLKCWDRERVLNAKMCVEGSEAAVTVRGRMAVVSTALNAFHGRINHKTCAIFYTLWLPSINVSGVLHCQNQMANPYCCILCFSVPLNGKIKSVIDNCVYHHVRVHFLRLGRRNVLSRLHWLRNVLSHNAEVLISWVWTPFGYWPFFFCLYVRAGVLLYADKDLATGRSFVKGVLQKIYILSPRSFDFNSSPVRSMWLAVGTGYWLL